MLELDESTGMSKDEVYGYFKNVKGLATYVYSQLPNDFGTFNGALRESATDNAVYVWSDSNVHDFYNHACIFANAAGTMMVSATSPIAQNQIGQSAMTAAMCVSAMTLFNMIGRISFGFIYDKLKGWNSLILVLVLNGISMLMLIAAQNLPYFLVCIALVGFSFGGLLVVFAPMVRIIFGSRFYNRNYGLIFIGYGIGAFVGPKISASFYDSTGSYIAGYIGSAVLAVAAIALVAAARKMAEKMEKSNLQ